MNTGYQEALQRIAAMPPDGTVDLRYLDLTVLPPLREGIRALNCSYNILTELPELPNSLQSLNCQENQLTSLPKLPASLQTILCSNNQLTSLPKLPTSLLTLDCFDNQLTRLPELPASLQELYCAYNQLTKLPELPDSLQSFFCNNNPFVEPFATYYTTYRQTNDIGQLRESIRAYYAPIKAMGRNVSHLMQTFGRSVRFPDVLKGEIAGFLSGKTLPSGIARPINQQLAELRAEAGVGGSRKKRATRRRSRKGLKGGKSKKRYHK